MWLTTLRFARPRAIPYETIEIGTADESTVTADVYRAAKPKGCVALFHQSGSSRGEFRTIAPELLRLGYTALAVDVRWGNLDRWNDVLNETAARHGDEQPRLVNMYGITETTVHVTYRPIGLADLQHPGNAPVGVPIPDLTVHLLGPHGELVPVGVPGEIHVGGAAPLQRQIPCQ